MLKVVVTFNWLFSTVTRTQEFQGGLVTEAEHGWSPEQFTVIVELWTKEAEPKVMDNPQLRAGTASIEKELIKTVNLEENSGTKTLLKTTKDGGTIKN